MKTLFTALAMGAMTIAASAEPMKLTDGQMDQVSAGVLDNNTLNIPIAIVTQANVPVTVNPAVAIGVLAENINAFAQAAVDSGNTADVAQ
jgi:hypothetical protein